MTGPDPHVAALRSAVGAATADLPTGALVLVACSGGPDSLALAAATAFVARRGQRRATDAGGPLLRAGAVVVDHGLQDGSAAVAEEAARVCADLGLEPVHVVRVDARAGTGGPEAAARTARYAALERVAVETGAAAVLLGHTLDDQAETVLLGLARGSGARSLAGMPAVRGLLRRPLLGLRRSDTLAACTALGLRPWHDPTNTPLPDDTGPLRSRVRAEVLPLLNRVLGPGVPQALARTADQLRADADALDALAADLLTRSRLDTPADPTGTQPVPGDGTPGAPVPADPTLVVPAPDPTLPVSAPAPVPPSAPASAVCPGVSHGVSAPADRRTAGTDTDARTGAPVPVVVLDPAPLAAAPAALRHRALRAAALAAGCPPGDLLRVHVLALDALVTGWRGQGPVDLPGARRARRACGRLSLGPAGDAPAPGRPVDAPASRRHERQERTAVDPADMGDDLEHVLLSEEQLHTRLDELAARIDADYAGRELLLVGVLKGAVMVMADLARRLRTPLSMDWMAVSSYGSGTKSSGVVRILKDLDTDLHDRHVLIVEDVVDSGLTLSWLLSNLRSRGPASVEIAAMLRKPEAAKVDVDVRYVGFDIPPEFVVGYGLDYAERYRNLPFVATLAPHVYGA